MKVFLLGATGFTGRFLLDQLMARKLPVVAVGRNETKLLELQNKHPDLAYEIADAQDEVALKALIGPGDLLISTVGPFIELGQVPLKVAVEQGAHYMDSTGEPAFMKTVYDQYENQLADGKQVILTACGFDYVPGQLVAASLMSAAPKPEEVDTLNVVYTNSQGRIATMSSGTLSSLVKALYETGTFYNNGAWEQRFPGDSSLAIQVPGGRTVQCMSLAGLECIEVPRIYPNIKNMNVYLGWFGPLGGFMNGFAQLQHKLFKVPGYLNSMRKVAKRVQVPTRSYDKVIKDQKSDTYLSAQALDAQGNILASSTLEGHNMYQYTVDIMGWIAQQIVQDKLQQHGVIGPVRAFGLEALQQGHAEIDVKLSINGSAQPSNVSHLAHN